MAAFAAGQASAVLAAQSNSGTVETMVGVSNAANIASSFENAQLATAEIAAQIVTQKGGSAAEAGHAAAVGVKSIGGTKQQAASAAGAAAAAVGMSQKLAPNLVASAAAAAAQAAGGTQDTAIQVIVDAVASSDNSTVTPASAGENAAAAVEVQAAALGEDGDVTSSRNRDE